MNHHQFEKISLKLKNDEIFLTVLQVKGLKTMYISKRLYHTMKTTFYLSFDRLQAFFKGDPFIIDILISKFMCINAVK